MKKLDLVKLINVKPYLKNNLQKNMYGIIINIHTNNADILFFNPKNTGDYAVVGVNISDISVEKEKLPGNIQIEILSKLDDILSRAKDILEPITIKEYDMVELIVEDNKYVKYGIHKGDIGCVMDNKAVQNYIEVDFSGVDENGKYYGECISVKLDDLKLLKNK